MTFVQLSARLKNFSRGWLLVLSIKEGLVECATVCVKSVVILQFNLYHLESMKVSTKATQHIEFQRKRYHNIPFVSLQDDKLATFTCSNRKFSKAKIVHH